MKGSSTSSLYVWCCLLALIQVTNAIEIIPGALITQVACEGSTLEAKCGFGEVIHLLKASYGRTSQMLCNEDLRLFHIDCYSFSSFATVQQRCSLNRSCEIPANSFVLGEPCYGVKKYLEMQFQCDSGDPLLITADYRRGIQAFNIRTSEDYPFEGEIKTRKDITAFDYVYRTKTIVWTDSRTHRIYSAPIESNGPIITVSSESMLPIGLAVDWIHFNVYWTDMAKKTIAVANLDGSWEKTLFETDHKQLGSIVVDPIQGWMFWTDWGDAPKIERAGMDGSHRSVIVTKYLRRPSSIAVDLLLHKIYWIDADAREMYTANYNGTERAAVFSLTSLLELASINIFKSDMFWTSFDSNEIKIYRRKFSGIVNIQILKGKEFRYLQDMKIFHKSQQPEGPSRCGWDNGGCSHLCLPTPKSDGTSTTLYSKPYRCACPNSVRNCSEDGATERYGIDDQIDEFNNCSKDVVFSNIIFAFIVFIALVKYIQ